MSTSLGWEGNRRSGVALAMRHRQQWFIHLRAQQRMEGRDEHHVYAPLDYGPPLPFYLSGEIPT